MSMHRPDCNCSECGMRAHLRARIGSVPRVSGGSRLIFGLGQDATSDDSVDTSNTDMSDPSADDSAPADDGSTDSADSSYDSSSDAPADDTSDASSDDASSDDSSDDSSDESADDSSDDASSDESVDENGLTTEDIMNILSSGLQLTSSGIKTAVALGIIKKPVARSASAQAAANVSPGAAAALAVQTGNAGVRSSKKSIFSAGSESKLPMVILAGLGLAVLLKLRRK